MADAGPGEMALLYRQLREARTVFAFSGVLSQDVVVGLGEALRQALAPAWPDGRAARRVFGVFVELAQNVLAHSADRAEVAGREAGKGIVLIRDEGDHWLLCSGNPVAAAEADALLARCRRLGASLGPELRRLRRETLRGEGRGDGRAGLGLLEMTRAGAAALQAAAEPLGPDRRFVVLKVRLDKERPRG